MSKIRTKRGYKVAGKSVKQLLRLSYEKTISRMSEKDLSNVVNRLVSATNKRIRRMSESDINKLSPALRSRIKQGGEFSVAYIRKSLKDYYDKNKGKKVSLSAKRRDEYLHVYATIKGYLKLKTSSVRGWKKVRQETIDRIGIEFATKEQADDFWEAYRRLSEMYTFDEKGTRGSRFTSDRIQELLAVQYKKDGFNTSVEDVVGTMKGKVEKLYEQMQRKRQHVNSAPSDINIGDGDEWSGKL